MLKTNRAITYDVSKLLINDTTVACSCLKLYIYIYMLKPFDSS